MNFNYNQQPMANGFNRPFGVPNYAQPQYMPQQQQMVQPQVAQQMQAQQPIMPTYNLQDVRYGTEDEIRGHIVYPTYRAIFIDRAKTMSYVKDCNINGESVIRRFKYVEVNAEGKPIEPIDEQPSINTADFVKKTDLEKYATAEQLNELLSKFESFKNKFVGVKPNVGQKNQ